MKKTGAPVLRRHLPFQMRSLLYCEGHAVCALVLRGIHLVCADLNRIQCAVILCVVMMSALLYRTFNAFITFFHDTFLLAFDRLRHAEKYKPQRRLQAVDKFIFSSRKGLGNKEFPKRNPQPEFTSGEENSEFQGF